MTDMETLRTAVLMGRDRAPEIPPDPCPFCKSEAALRYLLSTAYVACTGCGAAGPVQNTPEEAIGKWNERP